MGYVVEIRDVSFRSGRANCVPGQSNKKAWSSLQIV
jgi:hypothetical protein